LFDLLCTYKTTVANQLWLLKLIEMLHLAGYEVISANTDGVLLYIHESEHDSVMLLFKEWEKITQFTLEYAYYDLYVRRDVNTYLAKKIDGTVKIKGDFTPQGAYLYPYYKYDLPKADNGYYLPINALLKGFDSPIVAIALQRYYLDNIDPEITIYNHRDIYDFCMSQKIGKQFKCFSYQINRSIETHNEAGKEYVESRNIDTIISQTSVQKTLRFYVSRPTIDDNSVMCGNVLKKVKREVKPVKTLVTEKIIIPAEYVIEQRINPSSGRLKTYKDKIKDKEVIPAVYEMIEKEVVSESVLASGQFITMFNNYWLEDDFGDYNISYDYYLEKVRSEITKIGVNT